MYIFTYLYMEEYEIMMAHVNIHYDVNRINVCAHLLFVMITHVHIFTVQNYFIRVNFTKMILIQGHIHAGNDDACRHRIRILMHLVYTYVHTYVCTHIEKYV